MKILCTFLLCFIAHHFCNAQTESTLNKKEQLAPWFVQKYRISIGTFIPISNTNIQVGLTNGNMGTDIDFENDLGFTKSSGTFIAEFKYRLSKRSRFDLGYFRINRKSTKTITEDINFGEDTYPANTSIGAFFKTDIYRFSYGYSVIQQPKFEVGFLIGAHIINSKTGLSAIGNNIGISLENDFGFTAPLPDLGIWGGYTFSKRFAVNAEVNYLALKVGDIGGRILGGSLSFLYRVTKQFDLGLGYTGLNFNIDVTKPKLSGSFKWGYNGPSLTAHYSFGKKYWEEKK